jgi:deazaflavin-dependent oxidoreductase (nitroreductase family)
MPILLYRTGFGGLLGTRFLMLEHTGRISGATRHVILEVFNHPAPDIYVVAAGHGQPHYQHRYTAADGRDEGEDTTG